MSLGITDNSVLVTGANRGLGRALVHAALRRGAARVFAASHQSLRALLADANPIAA